MSSDKSKNDIKILFLICNSFGFAFGWIFFGSGVGLAAINGSSLPATFAIVLGIVIICVTLVGYSGAITENKKALRSYGTCMMLFAINEIIILARNKPAPRVGHNNDDMSDDEDTFVCLIFITILTLMSVLLAFALGGAIIIDEAQNVAISDQSAKREENAEAAAVKIIP